MSQPPFDAPVPVSRYPPPLNPHQSMPPPPPPPRPGGFGRMMLTYIAWGAGITIAFAGISALFGGRRSVEVHHPPTTAGAPTAPRSTRSTAQNPAATRPIFNCTVEEEVLRQCLANGGDCRVYENRVNACHKAQAEGKL